MVDKCVKSVYFVVGKFGEKENDKKLNGTGEFLIENT